MNQAVELYKVMDVAGIGFETGCFLFTPLRFFEGGVGGRGYTRNRGRIFRKGRYGYSGKQESPCVMQRLPCV